MSTGSANSTSVVSRETCGREVRPRVQVGGRQANAGRPGEQAVPQGIEGGRTAEIRIRDRLDSSTEIVDKVEEPRPTRALNSGATGPCLTDVFGLTISHRLNRGVTDRYSSPSPLQNLA